MNRNGIKLNPLKTTQQKKTNKNKYLFSARNFRYIFRCIEIITNHEILSYIIMVWSIVTSRKITVKPIEMITIKAIKTTVIIQIMLMIIYNSYNTNNGNNYLKNEQLLSKQTSCFAKQINKDSYTSIRFTDHVIVSLNISISPYVLDKNLNELLDILT